jgi:hypothetical protein
LHTAPRRRCRRRWFSTRVCFYEREMAERKRWGILGHPNVVRRTPAASRYRQGCSKRSVSEPFTTQKVALIWNSKICKPQHEQHGMCVQTTAPCMIWEQRCWRTLRAQKRARELMPPFCFLNYFTLFIHRWRGAYVLIATLARWTRWSTKVRHADHETTQSSLSTSIAQSNKDDARRWTCQIISFDEMLLRCCCAPL